MCEANESLHMFSDRCWNRRFIRISPLTTTAATAFAFLSSNNSDGQRDSPRGSSSDIVLSLPRISPTTTLWGDSTFLYYMSVGVALLQRASYPSFNPRERGSISRPE